MQKKSTTQLAYPSARTVDVAETLAGLSFADPYRWLEQDSDEVRLWQQAQAQLASSHVREWPHFDVLRQLVQRFSTDRFVSLPRYAAGRWFRTQIADGESQALVLVADEPMGEGRVLFDPVSENSSRPPFLSWIAPSPNGCTLALGVCADGSENNTIRLIDVASGRAYPDPPRQVLMDNWTGGVHWLPDSSGFFFSAITGAATEFDQCVYLHRLAKAPTTIRVEAGWSNSKAYRMVVLSSDSRHAVAIERLIDPIPVAIANLITDPLEWRPFVTSIAGTMAGHLVGDKYVAVTDVGAPRGRLVAIPIDAEEPSDPTCWKELVGETDATLRTVTPVGEALYLSEFVDTYSRVRIVDINGKRLGEVPLPSRGAVNELPFPMMNLVPKGHPKKFLFGFSSLTVSPGIYSHTPGEDTISTLRPPQVRLEDTVVEDRWAISADGARIPYHLVYRSDLNSHHPRPTLIYAYGGYKVALLPQFPGAMAAIIAAGGGFVHAHLRGGAEFGLDWWQSGRMTKKQNCYNDLFAIAEDLISAGLCTPRSLAVTGHSNGGLMAAVAATQRPDLWHVVVPRFPVLDLIGDCRTPYGRMSTLMDRADIDDPDEVRRLASFSPYHLVSDGVSYPAMFLDVGDTDPRCPPWHARKFAARLQSASNGRAPVLLRVWENVGHGWATDKKVAVDQNTEWLAFTLRHLGLNDWLGQRDVVEWSEVSR